MSTGRIYWVYFPALDMYRIGYWVARSSRATTVVGSGDDSGGVRVMPEGGVGASGLFDLASNNKWLAGHNKTCTSDVC